MNKYSDSAPFVVCIISIAATTGLVLDTPSQTAFIAGKYVPCHSVKLYNLQERPWRRGRFAFWKPQFMWSLFKTFWPTNWFPIWGHTLITHAIIVCETFGNLEIHGIFFKILKILKILKNFEILKVVQTFENSEKFENLNNLKILENSKS